MLFMFSSINLKSQTRVDSLEYLGRMLRVNYFNTRFEKQLNTFYLNSKIIFFKNFDNITIKLNENYSSTFIRNTIKNTRDEQHLDLNFSYNINKENQFGLAANSSILSDNRSLGINESSVNYASFFSIVKPINELKISPFAGYSSNRQIGITDNGMLYGIEGLLDEFDLNDININSELRFRNEDILPRRNLIRYYGLSVANYFDRNFVNNINTYFSQTRKDFYFDADSITSQQYNVVNNIQGRTETAYQIFDRLSYNGFLEVFTLDLSGGINWRKIDRDIRYKPEYSQSGSLYDTRIDELKLEFDAVTRYSSKEFDAALRLNYYERDEKHLVKKYDGLSQTNFELLSEREAQKDNYSNRTTLSLSGNLKFSKSDMLTFSLYQSKLIYDTQSLLNDDDRDELLSIIRLRYNKKLSSYFTGFINAEGTYGHTVYLFASRSSNNNQNRVIRLRTGGDYYGSFIQSFNSFEVSANYTVYDFEEVSTNYQSYSFRQFTAIDSTTINLTKKTALFAYGYLKLSEIGDFRWDSFTAKPTRFLEELYFEPRFILTLDRSIFSVGLRLFILNTYGYQKQDRILDTEYLSIGPLAMIDLIGWKRLNIVLKGYYEFISNTNSTDKEQASLIAQINWNF